MATHPSNWIISLSGSCSEIFATAGVGVKDSFMSSVIVGLVNALRTFAGCCRAQPNSQAGDRNGGHEVYSAHRADFRTALAMVKTKHLDEPGATTVAAFAPVAEWLNS